MSEAKEYKYFDRDVSWLSFNGRVLEEAGREEVPLGEKINFLSIFSSNLDEFYRVRIPALMAIHKISKTNEHGKTLKKVEEIINRQQDDFGKYLAACILPLREKHHVDWIYNQPIPNEIKTKTTNYFFQSVLGVLQATELTDKTNFFPENNKIYFIVSLKKRDDDIIKHSIVNIPSEKVGRFFSTDQNGKNYIVFLDDIIRKNICFLFPNCEIKGIWSFKITRDAELDLEDEYEGNLAQKIEKQLLKRDMGYATRFLYDGEISKSVLKFLTKALNLKKANDMKGGRYHNLKDIMKLPLSDDPDLFNEKWVGLDFPIGNSIFDRIEKSDFMIHTPYQNFGTALRFFNEAATDEKVKEIYLTIYRMAEDSKIGQALINAVKNGKKVTVFVEIKARFDEANNLKWAKRMKKAGIKIIYSIPGWKVHSKIAMAKREENGRIKKYGLLGTGNFNEKTAKIYADHILFTNHKEIVRELELLFLFLEKRNKSRIKKLDLQFKSLLVAQFNLHERFTELIDEEIRQAKAGKPSGITIKLNNLDYKELIDKLYKASQAGVPIKMMVRSICALVPGVKGMSENIEVHRVVDRYLEHGRIFVFHHGGEELIYAGSSDWMNRNIKRRIEVCYPIYNPEIKKQLKDFVELELRDNVKGVRLDEKLNNNPIQKKPPEIQSQKEIYNHLKKEYST